MGIGSYLIIVNLYYAIYLITKNVTIRKEVMKTMGEKNFLINLTEAKKTTEILQATKEAHKKINKNNLFEEQSDKELSKDELTDIVEFIRKELEKST